MKKWVIFTILFFFSLSTWADSSLVNLQIGGAVKGSYYLCLNNLGCVNIQKGKNKLLPLSQGDITIISLIDYQSLRVHPQVLPTSCKILINSIKKVVTVSGNITVDKQGSLFINNLYCSTSNK